MAIQLFAKATERKPYKIYKIDKLVDLINFVSDKCDEGDSTIFRGQQQNWPLNPKIARFKLDDESIIETEERMFSNFKRAAVCHLDYVPENDWGYLAVSQHHGLPTRLLDWTYNPLVAVWFCVINSAAVCEGNYGVVWMYTPDDEDFLKPEEYQQLPFLITRPVIFEPRHITPRIKAQDGVFTAHPYSKRIDNFSPYDKTGEHLACMNKILIPKSLFFEFRYDLELLGVHAASLFPDLDGLARYIMDSNSYKGDEYCWS